MVVHCFFPTTSPPRITTFLKGAKVTWSTGLIYSPLVKHMEKTSLDNVNTVHQLANLFWKLNKFRQTLVCSITSMCVTQSVTMTFSESLFQTVCQRSDFIVHQSWFVFCFHLVLKKTAPFSVNKRKSFNLPFTL